MLREIRSKFINTLLLLTVAIYLVLMLGPWSGPANAETGVVSGSVVNIRSGPVTQYGVAGPATGVPTLKVTLDGKQMDFEVLPRVENNRVLVPLRAIFEAMGARVEWNQATQTATATKDNITVVLPLNSTQATVNGVIWNLEVPAKVVQQRTLVPLRFVGEALGGTATWDQVSYTVVLQTPPPPKPVVQPLSSPVLQFEGLRILSERDDSGLRIVMGSGVKLETKLVKTGSKVSYEFANVQIDGTSYIEVPLGTQIIKVQGSNQGKNAVVEIQLPVGIVYHTASELEGKKEVLTIPNFITGVERSTFGNSGEEITISSTAPLIYTSNQTGTKLEVVLNNVLPGKAQASYNYDSRLISSMGFQQKTVGSQAQTVLTLLTNKAAKFAVGLSSDGTAMNIMFIDQSEIQPRVPMVVLDAGHGGKDTGARGDGIDEKDVNLAIVLKVGERLTQKGIKVVYTRNDDSYLSLDEITSIANLYNAALFVSIHNNANTSPDPSGTETYYYAPLETPELYIQKDERCALATRLQQALVTKLGRNDRGVKQANFAVLRNTQMPSALVEMAFISNPSECELLKQQQFRDLAAQAIADGIEGYIKENIK